MKGTRIPSCLNIGTTIEYEKVKLKKSSFTVEAATHVYKYWCKTNKIASYSVLSYTMYLYS